MDIYTLRWGKVLIKTHIDKPCKVLDVGSLDINGSFRGLFPKESEYIGIDITEGKSVDKILNGHDLTTCFSEGSFDVVVCTNMLEHDLYFWKTLEQINKVIKKGGLFFVGVPTFNFPIHEYPDDYYRFGESAIRQVILEGYEIIDVKELLTKPDEGEKGLNPVINALGRKL